VIIKAKFSPGKSFADGPVMVSEIKWQAAKPMMDYVQLNPEKEYMLEIKDIKNARSLNQNRLLWELIHNICLQENAPTRDEWQMYCILLREAKAKYTYVKVLEEALEDLKKQQFVRVLEILSYETAKGHKWANCRLYLGTSTMNTQEMTEVLDKAKEYCTHLGIDYEPI
jgi:hypothetical protein